MRELWAKVYAAFPYASRPCDAVAQVDRILRKWHPGLAADYIVDPLPSKARTRPSTLITQTAALCGEIPLRLAGDPSHDELQAVVSGLAGIAFERRDLASLMFSGVPPFVLDGEVREGFIVNPSRYGPDTRTS